RRFWRNVSRTLVSILGCLSYQEFVGLLKTKLIILVIALAAGVEFKDVAWGPSEFPKPPWLGPERRLRPSVLGCL
ncbi:MAG: hypothetical protein KTR27_01985, partial [Leptolyngbyaceae cyanobacterium MAG.088]|nr:hypothetical protein [Leptolyngbyaceae cyanobacterium MAG.088]